MAHTLTLPCNCCGHSVTILLAADDVKNRALAISLGARCLPCRRLGHSHR